MADRYCLEENEMLKHFSGQLQKKEMVQRRVNYSLMLGIIILLISFGLYFLFQVNFVQRSYLYPYPYQTEVQKYSDMYQVDSNLAAAVIKTESNFKHEARSHRGAIGLMQLMPDTAKWIAGRLDDKSYSAKRLHEPDVNIRYGIWYLAELQKEFHGNPVLVLAAYNAGHGNVREWMQENHWDMNFSDVDAIPFQETREYVKKVMKNKEKYKELYH